MDPIFYVTAFLMFYALLGVAAVLFISKRSKQPARRSAQFVIGLIGLVALYALIKAFNNVGSSDSYHYFAIVVFMIVAAASSKYFRRKNN
ncbi:hypothetical protein ACWHAM_05075 [Paenibacillus terrae]